MLNLVTRLPVLHGMNKVAGALLGAVKFLIVIWIIFLALTIVCNTKVGEAALQIIKKDCILSFIYDRDILIRIFMSILMQTVSSYGVELRKQNIPVRQTLEIYRSAVCYLTEIYEQVWEELAEIPDAKRRFNAAEHLVHTTKKILHALILIFAFRRCRPT